MCIPLRKQHHVLFIWKWYCWICKKSHFATWETYQLQPCQILAFAFPNTFGHKHNSWCSSSISFCTIFSWKSVKGIDHPKFCHSSSCCFSKSVCISPVKIKRFLLKNGDQTVLVTIVFYCMNKKTSNISKNCFRVSWHFHVVPNLYDVLLWNIRVNNDRSFLSGWTTI